MKKKDSKEVYEALLTAMQKWDLNLDNFVSFGSNDTSTIVGKNTRVSARLKKVYPFLTIVHCIAQRTNLAALQATSTKPCHMMSSKVDDVMNSLIAHFNKFNQRKSWLQKLNEELFESDKIFKHFIKIR